MEVRSFSFLLCQWRKQHATVVFDCRGLDDPQGKGIGKDGRDPAVQAYVFASPLADDIGDAALHEALAGHTVAFGCVGGKNRSVAMAERLAGELRDLGHTVDVHHLAVHYWS